jgi:hypothetical protein
MGRVSPLRRLWNPGQWTSDSGGGVAESSSVVREATLVRRRGIRTLRNLHRNLCRSFFGFQNCTKMMKYEALETKGRLQPQIVVSRAISGTAHRLEGLSFLVILGVMSPAQELTVHADGGGRGTGIEPSPRSLA